MPTLFKVSKQWRFGFGEECLGYHGQLKVQTRSLDNKIENIRSHDEKGRFRTPYHYGNIERKTRHGETEQTNDGQSCCMGEHTKTTCLCVVLAATDRGHDSQCHEAGHLIIFIK